MPIVNNLILRAFSRRPIAWFGRLAFFASISFTNAVAEAAIDAVEEYLDEAVLAALTIEDGIEETFSRSYDWLLVGETITYTAELDPSGLVFVLGACDDDCGDLDLRLLDTEGDVVDTDSEADSFPVLAYPTGEGGLFEIEVEMYECSADPCYFGIAILEQ